MGGDGEDLLARGWFLGICAGDGQGTEGFTTCHLRQGTRL